MKKSHLLPAFVLLSIAASAVNARAQFGSFGDIPIEISSEGETRFVNGVAVAENNVVIHYGTTSVYADYVQYNPETRDVLAIGNIRIYRDGKLVEGDRGLYNLETKLLRTNNFRTASAPFFAQGETINSMPGGGYEARNSTLTTSDSSKPDYQFKAGTAHIHPNDYVTLSNVTLQIGSTPVFWFPFIYQSLKDEMGFTFNPGYSADYGAYLLTRYAFPIDEHTHGALLFDLRSRRGVAVGLDTDSRFGPENKSWAKFRSYYAQDADTEVNHTANRILPVTSDRYRVTFQTRTYLTDDLYATANFNKLSDYRFLRDFFPSEYSANPQPDNVFSLTQWDEKYALTITTRAQINNFFDSTERLPEAGFDITRQPIFTLPGLPRDPVFYESQTSAGALARRFGTLANTDVLNPVPTSALLTNYNSGRFDTFHQFTLPQTYGGWLSVIPRVGLRGTYYSSGAEGELVSLQQATGLDLRNDAQTLVQQKTGSSVFRPVFNAGIDSSFKISREWEEMQSRTLGIDGLRHVIQPYTDLSFVRTSKDPSTILQFDRLNPSTELPSIDFPQFTSLDSIPDWTIWRFGVRNTLQTRRDDSTLNLVTMDTFFNANLEQPNYPGLTSQGNISNLCNRLTYNPFSWAVLTMDTQLPLEQATGFTQVNTDAHFLASEDLSFTIGHRYLENNPYFLNSSNLRFGAYYRINDNWSASFLEVYEFSDNTLQQQNYEIHRDLSSWIASLGLTIRENRNTLTGQTVSDIGVVLTFTLKDLPKVRLPVSLHPSAE